MKRASASLAVVGMFLAIAGVTGTGRAGLFDNIPKKCNVQASGQNTGGVSHECTLPYAGPLLQVAATALGTINHQLGQLRTSIWIQWRTPSGVLRDLLVCHSGPGPTGKGLKASVCPAQKVLTAADNPLPPPGATLRCLVEAKASPQAVSLVVEGICQSTKPDVYNDDQLQNLVPTVTEAVSNGIQRVKSTICERVRCP